MIENTNALQIHGEVMQVKGELCFNTISSLKTKPNALLANSQIQTIDLQGVTKCDTAGLALLLEWFCEAKQQNKSIQFVHVSQPILDFAAIHNLTNLLFPHAK